MFISPHAVVGHGFRAPLLVCFGAPSGTCGAKDRDDTRRNRATLIKAWKDAAWPLAFVSSDTPRRRETEGDGNPGPGDLIFRIKSRSALRDPAFRSFCADLGFPNLVTVGEEHHRMILATMIDTALSGRAVHLVTDAVLLDAGSPQPGNPDSIIKAILQDFCNSVTTLEVLYGFTRAKAKGPSNG